MSQEARAGATGTTTTRVGIVGCGAIAQIVHLPILLQLDGVRVAALCDPDLPKAETLAERLGVAAAHESVDELLVDPEIDALVICTPNHLHADQTIRALRAGKDVLCERPLGLDRDEVAGILAVAGETGCRVMVAHNHRYRPDVAAIRRFLATGELGEVQHVQATWYRRRTRRPRPHDWRRDRDRSGGGVLFDLGIQMLDMALWLLGYPAAERLSAHLRYASDDDAEDLAIALIRLAGGVTLSVGVSWGLAARDDVHRLEILGSRGSLSLTPLRVEKESGGEIVDLTPRLQPAVENVFTASYRRELEHFIAVVRDPEQSWIPEEQQALMAIVGACYRSAQGGREIEL